MKRVALLYLEGAYTSCLCKLMDVLRIAASVQSAATATHIDSTEAVAWDLISLDGLPPRATDGVPLVPDLSVAAADMQYDLVFVPATDYINPQTFIQRLMRLKPLYPWLSRQWERGALFASVGTGAFVLAEAGILDRRDATTLWPLEKPFHRRYPAVRIDCSREITESDRIYCGSVLDTVTRLSLLLVERLFSAAVSAQVASAILSVKRSEFDQYADCGELSPDDLVAAAQRWLSKNFANQCRVADIAASVGVSDRTLTRHFKKQFGITLHAYLQNLRIEHAKTLLTETDLVVSKIAERVGYDDVTFFKRIFRRQIGMTPTAFRKEPV